MERLETIRAIAEEKKKNIRNLKIIEKINNLFFSEMTPPFLNISEIEFYPKEWNLKTEELIKSELNDKLLVKKIIKDGNIQIANRENKYICLTIELDYCLFQFFKLQYENINDWSPWRDEFLIIFHNGDEVCSFNGRQNPKFSHSSSSEVFEPKSFFTFNWLQDFDRLVDSINKYESNRENQMKNQIKERVAMKEKIAAEQLKLKFGITENEIELFNKTSDKNNSRVSRLMYKIKKILSDVKS
jgi:hypothetical protein